MVFHNLWNVLAKFQDNPINSLKVDVFLPKPKPRFHLVKVGMPHQEIILPDKTANQWNKRTSIIYDNRSGFPGKKGSHCNMFFILLRGVQFRETMHIMAKTPKAKAKPVPKRLKAENSC